MVKWQKCLSRIRFLAEDTPQMQADIKFVWEHILRLEEEIDALRRAIIELPEHGGEGE